MLLRFLLIAAVAVFLFDPHVALAGQSTQPAKQPTATGKDGGAATVDALGTQAAIDTLRRGGNAVDAAVAAAGVLGVVEPFSCGIGGGGFMVIRTRKGDVTTIDSRELSPQAMRPDSFMENGAPLPFNDARYSGLSAGVPGTVAGWDRALDEYGTKDLDDVLEAGHPGRGERLRGRPDLRRPDDAQHPLVRRHPLHGRDLPRSRRHARDVGTVLRNPDMARTYRLIARRGTDGFYEGPVAEAMVEASQHPPVGPRRRPRLAPRPHDRGRRRRLLRPRARAGPHSLPRPRHLGHGPALERRLDRRRGAQHPRGLPRSAPPTALARFTSCSSRTASRSPTATPTSPTRASSTCRSRASCPTPSPPSGAR